LKKQTTEQHTLMNTEGKHQQIIKNHKYLILNAYFNIKYLMSLGT